MFPKYTQGIHQKNKTQMIISRGLGPSKCPLRLFNRPELVVITLEKEEML
jgi:predicted MPP superfamily phosphohydrolase